MANSDIDKCRVCGKTLVRQQRLYCSRGCRNRGVGATKRVTKTCVVCGAAFSQPQSNARRYSVCSAVCHAAYRKAINARRYLLSQTAESKARRAATFASRRLTVECGCGCGTTLLVPPNKLKQQVNGRVFLNRAHYEAWFRGENVTYIWKGGKGPEYYGPNWTIQRARALKRDLVCRACGAIAPLVVHHRTSFRDCPDYRIANRLGNLVTLCRPCHGRAHLQT